MVPRHVDAPQASDQAPRNRETSGRLSIRATTRAGSPCLSSSKVTERCKSMDQPVAALIRDLKQRGMLEDTLVIWTGEFGRTPDNNKRGGVYSLGRGHNNKAMTMLFAGGGVKKGSIVGATDELGSKAVEVVHPIRDLHVTLLHLLGLDDNKLTYFHGGRFKQLSQFGGSVIKDLIA